MRKARRLQEPVVWPLHAAQTINQVGVVMKLPPGALIAVEKATQYLLVPQDRGDKSAFLRRGGFTLANPDTLISNLAALRDRCDARLVEENKFGRYYEVIGVLHGPAGAGLRVRTIWMTEHLSGTTKFITLIPIEVLTG